MPHSLVGHTQRSPALTGSILRQMKATRWLEENKQDYGKSKETLIRKFAGNEQKKKKNHLQHTSNTYNWETADYLGKQRTKNWPRPLQ